MRILLGIFLLLESVSAFSNSGDYPRLSVSNEMLLFRCPEEVGAPQEKLEEDRKLTLFIEDKYYSLFLASSVSDTEINLVKRNFYEKRGCTKTLSELNAADAAKKAESERMLSEAQKLQRWGTPQEEDHSKARAPYIEKNPDSFMEFRTSYAEKTVKEFNFSCPQPGKSARLIQFLRKSVLEGAAMGGGVRKLFVIANSQGKEVRIYHQVRGEDGVSNNPVEIMSINQWGEIYLHGISKNALMLECYL